MPQPPECADAMRGAEDALAESERRAAVEALVAQLPEKLRLPVQLHYLNGMTQREVAATLGVPPSTVDSRLDSARRLLRPMAEKAGLREALGVLVAGGLAAGLMTPPAHLRAASSFAAASMAAGVGSFFLGAKLNVAAAALLMAVVATLVLHAVGSSKIVEPAEATLPPRPPRSVIAIAATPALPAPTPAAVAAIATPAPAVAAPSAAAAAPKEAPTRILSVIVADAIAGNPIPNAKVEVTKKGYERFHMTDKDGLARFDDVPRGDVTVSTSAEGFSCAGSSMRIGSSDPVLQFALPPGGTLFGRVTDESGQPVAGASVECDPGSYTPVHLQTVTDADGRWEIPNIRQGEPVEQLYFQHGDYAMQGWGQQDVLVIPAGETRHEANMTLHRTFRSLAVAGVVVDAKTGAPIADAHIGSDVDAPSGPVRTDTSGRFACERIIVRENTLHVSAEGRETANVWLVDKDALNLRIELGSGFTIAGRVTDENGKPVAGAKLGFGATTGADGRFRIENAPKDATLEVLAEGWPSQPMIQNAAGRTDLEIVLHSLVSFFGKVVDAETKEPLRQFHLRIDFTKDKRAGDPVASLSPYELHQGTVFDNPDGRFLTGGHLKGDVLALVVDAEGYATQRIDRCVAGAGPILFEMSKAQEATLRGTVVDSAGAPISNARIVAMCRETARPAGNGSFDWRNYDARRTYPDIGPSAYSAADGAFEIKNAPMPFGADLVVEAAGFGRRRVALDSLPATPVAVALQKEARLRLHVDRAAFPKAYSMLLHATESGDNLGEFLLDRDEKVVEIGALAPGRYYAKVLAPGKDPRGGYDAIWSDAFAPAAGETLDLDIGIQPRFDLRGHVVENGEVCCEKERALLSHADDPKRWGKTDGRILKACPVGADGSFAFEDIEPGNYSVAVVPQNDGFCRWHAPAGDPVTVEADVAGMVVHRRRGGGVTGRIVFAVPYRTDLPWSLQRTDQDGAGWRESFTVSDGEEFRLLDVPPGTYQIEGVTAENQTHAAAQGIVVVTGQTTDIGTVTAR